MRPFLLGLLGGLVAICLVVALAGIVAVLVVRARTPDRRAAILADLGALDQQGAKSIGPLASGCLTTRRPAAPVTGSGIGGFDQLAAATAQLEQAQYDQSGVFLRQHPALDRYVTWYEAQGGGYLPVCSAYLRMPRYLDAYLAAH